jgi:uncharacterized protein YhfF
VQPLPSIRGEQVAAFWRRFIATGLLDSDTPIPQTVEAFGDSAELADELIELVLWGRKRATAGALADFEHDGAPPPVPGDIWIASDGSGHARAVIRVTDVRIGPLSSVDEQFARDEGEGDRTLKWWIEAHESFFRRYLPTIGVEFHPDQMTVFERFEVLFSE